MRLSQACRFVSFVALTIYTPAYKSHGTFGRRLVELCLSGLLFGMIVGLNVAIGDLGSEVLSTVSSLKLMLAFAVPKVLSKHFSLEYFRFWQPEGLVRCVPIIASSLCYQVQVSTICTSLKNPPLVIMKKVLIYAFSFIFIYYSVSVCLWKYLTSSLFLQQVQQTNNTNLEIQDTNA
ncbi:sodium coupled neutral amino acid [Echinococcus multilocularis]|uniref:Sodium coupled neutral amino acid n=1 Tax=Echinococcus multilocularis TaxID=6211 RepID=A0A068YA50_ECHMU|nr:sodium coupled neutral amino acid [Echinococcus multilocularis]